MTKAWLVTHSDIDMWDDPENPAFALVRADDETHARSAGLNACDYFEQGDYIHLRAKRLPAFDERPMSPYNLIVYSDIYSWYECHYRYCGNQCHSDHWENSDGDERRYTTPDGKPWTNRPGDRREGALFCSERCQERDWVQEYESTHLGWVSFLDPYRPATVERRKGADHAFLTRTQIPIPKMTEPNGNQAFAEWHQRWALVSAGVHGPLARVKQPAARIVHVNDNVPGAVYIGRENGRAGLKRSIWHNPFKIGPDGNRFEVLAKYALYLNGRSDLLARIGEIADKPLACWCRHDRQPETEGNDRFGYHQAYTPGIGREEWCHGDVLMRHIIRYIYARENGKPWPHLEP